MSEKIPALAVPTLADIAKMYQHATQTQNGHMKTLAEQAVARLALAESAAIEAATFVAFHSMVEK